MNKKQIKPTSLPFWSWNDELMEDKLIEQIHKMKEHGYGGFFMHARSGLKTEYLSEKWFSCIRVCCEEAKKLGMQAWAYDENGWPSGFVGGKLLETKEYRLHYLDSSCGLFDKNADYHYEIKDGTLVRNDVCSDAQFVNVFDKESVSLADVLNGKVVDEFIRQTHEKYKKEIPAFSDNIVGFFTDEPQYCETFYTPYSLILPIYYENKYQENLFDKLGLLFYEGEGYEKFRYRYYKCCQELFLKNFAEKIYDWCNANGVKITGHYVEERTMFTQMLNNAGIMPYYEFMHMPGIDWLCRRYLFVSTIRQLTSVTAQLQKEFALSEMFAMTGWDVTPKELKSIADYQYNYGINVMCHHLLPYSERGERKNDFPAHFSSFNAWIDNGIADFNRYFDMLGDWIRNSEENVNVGVLFTVRSTYLKYDSKDWDSCEELDVSYIEKGCMYLASKHVPFHILDETLLARYGSVKDAKIVLGACAYETLVVPKSLVIDKTTDVILKEFVRQGGKVLLLDGKPLFVEGEPADFDYLSSNITYEDICINNEYFLSSDCDSLHTSLRTVNGKKYVFVVNIGEEEISTDIKVNGISFNGIYNVMDDTETFNGTIFTVPPKQSLIACYTTETQCVIKKDYESVEIGDFEYEVVDFNANYLALDFASLSYDGINFEDKLPVVGIFRRLLEERYKGKIYLKHNFTIKENVDNVSLLVEDAEKITATLNGKRLVFDGVSALDEIYKSACLAKKLKVGENQLVIEYDFYQDDNVYYALFGEGVTESIRNCMTYNSMITVPYLCGKFGVYSDNFTNANVGYVHADSFYLAKSPKTANNLVEQGFPFFAGNITLKRNFNANTEFVKLKFNGRFHIAEVFVNNNFAGKLMFTDTINVSPFVKKGDNQLVVKLYSGNRNLLGPHHVKDIDLDTEVVPSSFDFSETWTGNSSPIFTNSYSFSKFGLFDDKKI